ncbi:hypothetical protein MESS4_30007 [Mesorhizobium sp. STM 4661]|nr:hypothetical protein MESS4_30007 [Mesorhizobium sp. STM 4661]
MPFNRATQLQPLRYVDACAAVAFARLFLILSAKGSVCRSCLGVGVDLVCIVRSMPTMPIEKPAPKFCLIPRSWRAYLPFFATGRQSSTRHSM